MVRHLMSLSHQWLPKPLLHSVLLMQWPTYVVWFGGAKGSLGPQGLFFFALWPVVCLFEFVRLLGVACILVSGGFGQNSKSHSG